MTTQIATHLGRGTEFEVLSVDPDSPDLLVKAENAGKSEKTFRISHKVQEAGFKEKSICFKVQLKDKSPREISVRVTLSWQSIP